MIIPEYLSPGDTIGIAATARKVNENELSDAITFIEKQGFKVVLAPNIYLSDNQFSGNDEKRAAGINALLADAQVKAIWMARGGYGSVRTLDKINWGLWRDNPKWLCGFSDATALHSHLHVQLEMASIHSEMMLGFADNTADAHHCFMKSITGQPLTYHFPNHSLNRPGVAKGKIIGGNLSVLYSLLGSESQMKTSGKILFLEDLDEYLYHIDRMMMALKRAAMLDDLAGLVVGGMSDMHDNAVPFGQSAEEIIRTAVDEFGYPVYFGFPAGHIPNNCAIRMGCEATLQSEPNEVLFMQEA